MVTTGHTSEGGGLPSISALDVPTAEDFLFQALTGGSLQVLLPFSFWSRDPVWFLASAPLGSTAGHPGSFLHEALQSVPVRVPHVRTCETHSGHIFPEGSLNALSQFSHLHW